MFNGNVWIIIGIIASAIAAFALPYGFYLKGQERKVSLTNDIRIHGDLVNGNKVVIENQVNVNAATEMLQSDDATKINVAKLKIDRAFKDFDKSIEVIRSDFIKESDAIAVRFNIKGVGPSGGHIRAQMDLSVNTKNILDEEFEGLKRGIEDILIETLNKTSMDSAGVEFNSEQKRLDEAKKYCVALYPLLSDTPRNWEQKVLNEVRLTKDFDVANSAKQ